MRAQRERIETPTGQSLRVIRWSRSLLNIEVLLGNGRTQTQRGEGLHWHYHSAMELTLFTSGAGIRFVGDHITPFEPGDIVLLGERLPHHWSVRGDSSGISVQWEFPPSHAIWSLPESQPLAQLFERARRGLQISGRTSKNLTPLILQLAGASGPDRLGLWFRTLALIHHSNDSDLTSLSSRPFDLPASSRHEQVITEAIRFVHANFRKPIRLNELLALTHMSKATFSRQFLRHAGKPLSAHLTSLRIQAAQEELRATDRSVLDIALGCGFTQLTFFSRTFRAHTGTTPTQYRSRLSSNRSRINAH
jgi:AraC-like DNA-binding protein/mannose-6-phosphate isomerase-like protein (cupin superfamily)